MNMIKVEITYFTDQDFGLNFDMEDISDTSSFILKKLDDNECIVVVKEEDGEYQTIIAEFPEKDFSASDIRAFLEAVYNNTHGRVKDGEWGYVAATFTQMFMEAEDVDINTIPVGMAKVINYVGDGNYEGTRIIISRDDMNRLKEQKDIK